MPDNNEILSQEEIDALLKGISGGEVETETAEAPSGIRSYDFTSQEKLFEAECHLWISLMSVSQEHFA